MDPKVDKKKYVFYNFLAGGTASCCTISFLYPLDLARTRVSTDIGKNKIVYKIVFKFFFINLYIKFYRKIKQKI